MRAYTHAHMHPCIYMCELPTLTAVLSPTPPYPNWPPHHAEAVVPCPFSPCLQLLLMHDVYCLCVMLPRWVGTCRQQQPAVPSHLLAWCTMPLYLPTRLYPVPLWSGTLFEFSPIGWDTRAACLSQTRMYGHPTFQLHLERSIWRCLLLEYIRSYAEVINLPHYHHKITDCVIVCTIWKEQLLIT